MDERTTDAAFTTCFMLALAALLVLFALVPVLLRWVAQGLAALEGLL